MCSYILPSASTSEPILDIALVAAVLAVLVAVADELLPAILAGAGVIGFAFHQFRVAIPPEHSTFVRAESFCLSASILLNRHSAMLTI